MSLLNEAIDHILISNGTKMVKTLTAIWKISSSDNFMQKEKKLMSKYQFVDNVIQTVKFVNTLCYKKIKKNMKTSEQNFIIK